MNKSYLFKQIVPIDAIRHIEFVSDDDRQAMKERYTGRFILADEIVGARNLSEAELKNLARKYNVRSDKEWRSNNQHYAAFR